MPYPSVRFGTLLLSAVACILQGSGFGNDPQDLEGPDSLNWPKEIDSPEFKIILYQPQLETFTGNQLTARAAVSVQKNGAANPVFGAV